MKYYLTVILIALSTFVYADNASLAPVVDAGQDSEDTQLESVGSGWQNMQNAPEAQQPQQQESQVGADVADKDANVVDKKDIPIETTGSLDERVDRLSRQVANLTSMNLPQQITKMRDNVSQLQGEVEVAERDLKMLSQQQARLYQDLSNRIAQLEPNKKIVTKALPDSNPKKTASNEKMTDVSSYQKAFSLLAGKKFDEAEGGFQKYIKDYPKGKFVANAHYWLGEIGMHNKQYDDAYGQFQLLIAEYPKSNKVADAKLKIAIIHAEKGKKALAKIELKQVESAYPGSTAAQLASIQLQRL